MISCQLCEKKLKNLIGLATHIMMRHSEIGLKSYYDQFMRKPSEGKCKICGKELRFCGLGGYLGKYCSNVCQLKDPIILEKLHSKEHYQKIMNGCFKKYGNPYYNNREKYKKTCLERYGVDNIGATKEWGEKVRKTSLERYGVDHPGKTKEVQEKRKRTNLKKYGYEVPTQNKEISLKVKKTWCSKSQEELDRIDKKHQETYLKKTGYRFNFQDPNVRKKILETNLKRYGVRHANQLEKNRKRMSKQTSERIAAGWRPQDFYTYGRRTYLKNFKHAYRSTWEALFQILNPTCEYEALTVPYKTKEDRERSYMVDFIDNQAKKVYEVKSDWVFRRGTFNCLEKEAALIEWCKNSGYSYERIGDAWYSKHKNLVDINNYV